MYRDYFPIPIDRPLVPIRDIVQRAVGLVV
jgi:hypothetical protein